MKKRVTLDSFDLDERAAILAAIAAKRAAKLARVTEEPMTTTKATRAPRSPRLDLQVTPEIIERALPADSGHCIYADAIKEAFPNATHVSVDLQTCRFTDPDRGLRYVYLTPRAAQVDLVNFDQGIKPAPKMVRLGGAHVLKSNQRAKGDKTLTGGAKVAASTTGVTKPGSAPRRVGGQEPPTGAFGHVGGHRRSFGLRGLGRVIAPTPVAERG